MENTPHVEPADEVKNAYVDVSQRHRFTYQKHAKKVNATKRKFYTIDECTLLYAHMYSFNHAPTYKLHGGSVHTRFHPSISD